MNSNKTYRYGGGRAGARPSRAVAKRSRPGAGLVALVLSVAFVSLVAWWLWPKGGAEPLSEAPKRSAPKVVKEVKPAIRPKGRLEIQTQSEEAKKEAEKPAVEYYRGSKVVSRTVTTNGWSTYERIVTADGKSHGIIGTAVKPVFDNGSDQMLAMALRASRDSEMPPMPLSPMLDRDFRESLKKPIVIKDDDSEEVKQIKRDVIQAREDMKGMLDRGMTVQQALEEHFRLSNENVGIRNKAVSELRAILDSGDEEGAIKYVEAVNGTLERMGIMKLELPDAQARRRTRKEER